VETRLEDLRKWFGKGKKGDWVRVGTDGEIKGQCAREPGEGKPKCMPRSKAHSMDKKDRASSARRKRRADPDADRPGTGNKPIMVKTDKKESVVHEDVNVKSIDKFKAAARDFDKNKDINFQSIADALSKIVTAGRMLDKSTSGRTDVKYEKIISKESSRINNIVNKLNYGKGGVTPEGKEIVKLLNKHGLNRPFRTIIFEGVEMNEAADLMKMSKELLKHKDKGVNYEKAAAYVRAIHNNSALSVQDKAMKGLLDLLKNMDLTDRTTITKILKDNGFKMKGGRLMREEVESLDEKTNWKMGDGRPRNGARIQNDRFWNLPRASLEYIRKDAHAAMKANPNGKKAGKYADEVNDAETVLAWRKKNGIRESVDLDEATAKIKTTMADKVASSATRFGLKATTKGGHVSISGSKGKLNDFMRAIIGRSSFGNASDVTESVELEEKNVPTNPALWSKFKAQAKAKFDVYPSAYANGWAAKKYKAAGGGWKTTKESTEMKSFWDIRESLDLVENYRTLARAGMGTESKGEARVGLELDYYDGTGTKRMGKITKVTPKGYMVKDDKDGKVRQFTFHDRAKAKEILARIGKGKYNESVELDEAKDDDWVVVKGRKVVRTLKNPKNNKAPRNWQKSSDETEVIRVSKAKKMGIKVESVELDEQFVVKYAKNKRGPIYQTKFKTQPEAEKFLAQKRKEGMNGIVSKAGKPVSMQKMADLQKEESCDDNTMNAQTKKDEKPPFVPTRKVGVKKDRFGNVVKDKNRAKHLAKLAMRGEKK